MKKIMLSLLACLFLTGCENEITSDEARTNQQLQKCIGKKVEGALYHGRSIILSLDDGSILMIQLPDKLAVYEKTEATVAEVVDSNTFQ